MSLEKLINATEKIGSNILEYIKSVEKLVDRTTEKIGSNTLEYAFDDPLSKGISFIGNLPYKLILLSKDVGNYPRENTQKYISEYIADEKLENVTVRIGHNRVVKDTIRLFKDEKLKDISLLGKIFLGIPSTILGGIYSKFTRADYYNPFTRTAVIYSDVPAIAVHELAHAKDYQDIGAPTLYSLFRSTGIGALYQEARASLMAHKYLKGKERTGRYLIPAFLTHAFNFLLG
ncbi:MAG: hypothetical protein AABX99_00415 [Nanoarchaeota archaeon]